MCPRFDWGGWVGWIPLLWEWGFSILNLFDLNRKWPPLGGSFQSSVIIVAYFVRNRQEEPRGLLSWNSKKYTNNSKGLFKHCNDSLKARSLIKWSKWTFVSASLVFLEMSMIINLWNENGHLFEYFNCPAFRKLPHLLLLFYQFNHQRTERKTKKRKKKQQLCVSVDSETVHQ